MRALVRCLLLVVVLAALGWCALVLAYTVPGPPLFGRALGVAAVVAGVAGFWRLGSFPRGAAFAGAIFLAVLAWYLSLEPQQDANWQPDVAELPRTELDGDRLTIHNVRNFDYRSETEFTPRWETRSYDLTKLVGADMFFSHWSGPAIAHTILSWEFSDGQHLAISIETRKRVGQEYSAIAGFFRQYPIYYVVADERDVVRLRTNFRGENVWMYRLKPARPDAARALLLDYVASIDALAERPAWYNALTDNCTTTIQRHARHIHPGANPLDWRLLVNGRLPELLYARGRVDTSVSFEELRRRAHIDARAKAADRDPDFSARIRAWDAASASP
jgi:hypothetical protein